MELNLVVPSWHPDLPQDESNPALFNEANWGAVESHVVAELGVVITATRIALEAMSFSLSSEET